MFLFILLITNTLCAQWTEDSNLISTNTAKVVVGASNIQGNYGTLDGVLEIVSPSNQSSYLTLKSDNKSIHLACGPFGNALYIPNNEAFSFAYGGNKVMTIDPSGNIGMGTSSPTANLSLSGGIGDSELLIEADTDNSNEMDNPFITFSQDNSQVQGFIGLIGNNNTAAHVDKYPRWVNEGGTWVQKTDYPGALANYLLIGMNNSEGVQLGSSGNARLTVHHNGNVGIGTTNPDMKLTVKGKIHAEEVAIDLSVPAPDYVFKDDYNLRSIEEVEKFIKENNHLPEIPSAKEFEQNGVMQAEMDMNLLKKIEELTLYTIQQQKEITELKILVKKILEKDKKKLISNH